jgi:hypothetical protein
VIVFREEYVVYTTHIIYEYGIFQGIKCCNIIYPKNVEELDINELVGKLVIHFPGICQTVANFINVFKQVFHNNKHF